MLARRVQSSTESAIRHMTRLAIRQRAVNLAKKVPDFDTPNAVTELACPAVCDGHSTVCKE